MGRVRTSPGWRVVIPSDNAGRALAHLRALRADEPGPDAMRWTPDVADAEIAAWQQILHPQQAQ